MVDLYDLHLKQESTEEKHHKLNEYLFLPCFFLTLKKKNVNDGV